MPAEQTGAWAFDLELAPVNGSLMAVAHSLLWSTSELHAVADPAGRPPLATGPWVAAWIAGRFQRSGAPEVLRGDGVDVGDLLEMDVTYSGPVYGGDQVGAHCTVRLEPAVGTELGRRVTVEDRCFDAHQRPVLTSLRTYAWTPSAGEGTDATTGASTR